MDRVSTHGPFITKQRAAELGVLESATGYELKEDGTWKALDPADKPTEQSATVFLLHLNPRITMCVSKRRTAL